jgi:hypothetical protein
LSNQSANAAINSLDQFFSSLSSSVINKGAQLFSQLKDLKVHLSPSFSSCNIYNYLGNSDNFGCGRSNDGWRVGEINQRKGAMS